MVKLGRDSVWNPLPSESVSIRAVELGLYDQSPLQIGGRLQWSKGVWKWVLGRSIFTDTMSVDEKAIEGVAKVVSICRGVGATDVVFLMDSFLYEVITPMSMSYECVSGEIELGQEYSITLYPYYNYPFTMAYRRNDPIYLNGYVVWIGSRLFHSNIYICPNLEGLCYRPINDAKEAVLEAVRFRDR